MGVFCRCPFCHAHLVADLREAKHRGDDAGVAYFASEPGIHIPPMVPLHDELETLVAQGCSCRTYHHALRSFLTPPPKAIPPYLLLPPPNPFNPDSDSQSDGGSNDDTDS